jgi:hypothetical protein
MKYASEWLERNTIYREAGTIDGPLVFRRDDRPIIVCLCGSTQFKDAFMEANRRETADGKIVLSVGWFTHDSESTKPTDQEKAALDRLHFDKIDLADEVLFLNVDGYVGDSTRREFARAVRHGKIIRWLEPSKIPPDLV